MKKPAVIAISVASALLIASAIYLTAFLHGRSHKRCPAPILTPRELQDLRDEATYWRTLADMEQEQAAIWAKAYDEAVAGRKTPTQHVSHARKIIYAAGGSAIMDTLLLPPRPRPLDTISGSEVEVELAR